jgi:hypothetical protein
MPSRKKTLHSQPFDDILLLGIATTLPDYKLAWHLNNSLSIDLIKHDDIFPEQYSEQEGFSFYLYDQGENMNVFNLVSLQSNGNRWIKLRVSTDYLFIIRNALDQERLDQITRAIRNIPQIVHAFVVDTQKTKGIDILLETIEFHEMEILKSHHQRLPKNKNL